jgi:hypothetical protein
VPSIAIFQTVVSHFCSSAALRFQVVRSSSRPFGEKTGAPSELKIFPGFGFSLVSLFQSAFSWEKTMVWPSGLTSNFDAFTGRRRADLTGGREVATL